jgi:predicted SAM-dependent methyltransferase
MVSLFMTKFTSIKSKIGLKYYLAKLKIQALFEAILFFWRVQNSSELKIVVGSSGIFQSGWIPTNYQYLNLLNDRHWRRVFFIKRIDAILAEHVFEHLSESQGREALNTCHKYMKKGGRLRVAVPDGYSPSKEYIDMVKPGGTGEGSGDHKILYNVILLQEMLVSAGFAVERLEYYDSNGVFHHSNWNPSDGMIHRSLNFDSRNADGVIRYTSLILDGFKV